MVVFLLKAGKKKKKPSGSLEKNPLIYHVNGYHGLKCIVSIDDSNEYEKKFPNQENRHVIR